MPQAHSGLYLRPWLGGRVQQLANVRNLFKNGERVKKHGRVSLLNQLVLHAWLSNHHAKTRPLFSLVLDNGHPWSPGAMETGERCSTGRLGSRVSGSASWGSDPVVRLQQHGAWDSSSLILAVDVLQLSACWNAGWDDGAYCRNFFADCTLVCGCRLPPFGSRFLSRSSYTSALPSTEPLSNTLNWSRSWWYQLHSPCIETSSI